MTDFNDNSWLNDGIPVLSDFIEDDSIPELRGIDFSSIDEQKLDALSRRLQVVFDKHTENVIRGILDESPEQQKEVLFLKIRECLKQELPSLLNSGIPEQNHDDLDS
jgi:hypothetical protein